MLPWLSAFLVTQLVECPIYARVLRQRLHPWRLAFMLSAITHPIVFFIFPKGSWGGYWSMVSAAELFAVVSEALLLSALGVKRSIAWALVANAASVTVGLGLRWGLNWP